MSGEVRITIYLASGLINAIVLAINFNWFSLTGLVACVIGFCYYVFYDTSTASEQHKDRTYDIQMRLYNLHNLVDDVYDRLHEPQFFYNYKKTLTRHPRTYKRLIRKPKTDLCQR